jgi:hypothetical protein
MGKNINLKKKDCEFLYGRVGTEFWRAEKKILEKRRAAISTGASWWCREFWKQKKKGKNAGTRKWKKKMFFGTITILGGKKITKNLKSKIKLRKK